MKILNFSAFWCGACQKQAQILDEFAALYPNVVIEKINVDQNPSMIMRHHIDSLPTLIVLDVAGIEVTRHVGLASLQQLEKLYGSD